MRRNPRDYFAIFDSVETREADGRYAHFELISCKCVDTYVRIKKNQNQVRCPGVAGFCCGFEQLLSCFVNGHQMRESLQISSCGHPLTAWSCSIGNAKKIAPYHM